MGFGLDHDFQARTVPQYELFSELRVAFQIGPVL